MSTPVSGDLPESTFRTMAYETADSARAHFTDASIHRVLARGVAGEQTWREVYDTITGAISAKERIAKRAAS